MKSIFRPTTPEDAPAVSAFLERVFGAAQARPLIEPRLLHWKCWEPRPDWPGSRGYVIVRDDAIVAHGAVVPISCLYGERRIRMLHLIDWAADPRAVGSGAMLLRRIAQMVDAILVVGGSEMTDQALPALGFKTHGEVSWFARPLRPLRQLARQKFSIRTSAQAARNLLWSMQAPAHRTPEWTATRTSPEHWPNERTREIIAYLLKCPATQTEIYSVPRGYFILTHSPLQAQIADFYIDSDDPRDWQALIQRAVSQARSISNPLEILALGSDPVTSQALQDAGFHNRATFPLRLLTAKGVKAPQAPIRFQMIDSDEFYLHATDPILWT